MARCVAASISAPALACTLVAFVALNVATGVSTVPSGVCRFTLSHRSCSVPDDPAGSGSMKM